MPARPCEGCARGRVAIGYARRMRVLALATFALVLAPSFARADAIMGPPEDCAPGSQAMSSHWGQWCEDTTCASDADCPSLFDLGTRAPITRVCQRTSVCVPHGTTSATGPRTLDSPRGAYRGPGRRVTGACSPDGTCSEGVCDTAPRCVIQATQALAPPTTPPATTSVPTTITEPPSAPAPTTNEASSPAASSPTPSGSSCSIRHEPTSAGRSLALVLAVTLGALARRRRT